MVTNKMLSKITTLHQLNRLLLLSAALLMIWCLSVLPVMSDTAYEDAEPRDINMSLILLTKSGTITAYEPLLAKIETYSLYSKDIVELICPNDLSVEVRDEKGMLLASTPDRFLTADNFHISRGFAVGETHSMNCIVSGLYRFDKPGRYNIIVKLLNVVKEVSVIKECSATVKVLPFNAKRLEERCEEIFEPIRNYLSHETDLSKSLRTKALYTVHNDVVLPYLEWLARNDNDEYACRAMLNIGSKRAKNIVNILAARQDETGKSARKAQHITTRSPNIYWDMDMGE